MMKAIFSIWIVCVVSTLCLAADPERPPPLTFDKHVDYLKWYDDLASKGKSDNALEVYKKLCADEAGNGGLQAPMSDAAEQFEKALKHPWNAEDFPQLKAYLDQNEQFLSQYRLAARKPHFWQTRKPGTQTWIEIILPTLAPCRNASKALIVQGWMRGDRHTDQLLANWQTILGNARQLGQEPVLIAELVCVALRSTVCRQARAAANEKIIKGKIVRQAISLLQENDPGSPSLTRAVMVEWAMALDTLQHVAPNGKLDEKQWDALRKARSEANQRAKYGPFDPQEALDKIEDYFPKLAASVKGSPSMKRMQKVKNLWESFEPTIKHDCFLSFMLPNYSRAFELVLRNEVDYRATLLVLGMHDYKNKHKEWPKTLADLKIKGLKSLRIDPYSDKDFIYKLSDKGPLLYSIGADGKDDGGRHDEKWGEGKDGGDFVFWPVQD
jgi:hypothetical protein